MRSQIHFPANKTMTDQSGWMTAAFSLPYYRFAFT
jgi:hypothetical protein